MIKACLPNGTAQDGRGTRRASTRRDILAAAEELVLERGLDGLRTKDLVERSGVSERTIFNHFGNLEATALTRIEDYLTPLFSGAGVPADLPVEQLPEAVRERFLQNLRSPEGLENLAGFVRLAAALAPSSEEILTRHVLLTLINTGGTAMKQVATDHPHLCVDQYLKLHMYITNLVLAAGMGLARSVFQHDPPDSEGVADLLRRAPAVEDIIPHIDWAFRQVDAGLPSL